MQTVHAITRARTWIKQRRGRGGRVALVPTMGALHEGHLSLVDTAKRHAEHVVVSIFINPKQFAAGEDLDSYPRTLDDDVRMLEARGVGLVFAPSGREMYPDGFQTAIEVTQLGTGKLCAISRPHFFGGVATVVMKLLNIAMADVAIFGEKDYQQLQVIRRMCADMNHLTEIIGSPLVREESGLAMSSRNRYLAPQQAEAATAISKALFAMQRAVAKGHVNTDGLVREATAMITAAGGRVDYVQTVDAATLEPIASVQSAARCLAAVWFGEARLIDNIALDPPTAR